MAFITLPGGVKVEVKFTVNGQVVVNIYHFTTSDPITTVNLSLLCEAIKSAWQANLRAACSDQTSLVELIATDVSEEDGIQVSYTTGLPDAGDDPVDTLPNNVAIVISNKSVFTGRSRRGRTYVAGFSRGFVDDNTPSPTLISALLAYQADVKLNAAAEGFDVGVASYVNDGAPRTTALFTTYTAFTVDAVTDSQRRRLPGRGI